MGCSCLFLQIHDCNSQTTTNAGMQALLRCAAFNYPKLQIISEQHSEIVEPRGLDLSVHARTESNGLVICTMLQMLSRLMLTESDQIR